MNCETCKLVAKLVKEAGSTSVNALIRERDEARKERDKANKERDAALYGPRTSDGT